MGLVQKHLEEIAKIMGDEINKQGALLNALPYVNTSINYYIKNSKYKKQWKNTYGNHNIKKINLDKAIRMTFTSVKYLNIAIGGSVHLKPSISVYYIDQKRLKSFMYNNFKEDKTIRYFKLKDV